MLSFHNDIEVKNKYVNRVLAHQKADEIVQRRGWENGRGCAVGCTLENYDHTRYPIELGLPIWLAILEDVIHEGLPLLEAKKWPLQFLKAIPLGITEQSFEDVRHKIALLRQKRNLKIQKKNVVFKKMDTYTWNLVVSSLQKSIDYHKNPTAWSAGSVVESAWSAARYAKESAVRYVESAVRSAESAAWSAGSAAESAARSAESAVRSAESTARSAESAGRSAGSVAWSAAYRQEAKDLLRELKRLR